MKKTLKLIIICITTIYLQACTTSKNNIPSQELETKTETETDTVTSSTDFKSEDNTEFLSYAYQTSNLNNSITPDLFPKTSRYIHNLNMELFYALKPALDDYKKQKFNYIHTGFSNMLHNLQEPINATNALLQLDLLATIKTTTRFILNSTIGFLGIFDPAKKLGLNRDNRDFGETLGVWGVPMGGFFVLPFYAQTTTREFIGDIVDSFINPMNFYGGWGVTLFVDMSTSLLSIYDNYEFIITTAETSLDSYETFKTMYLQYRKNMIEKNKLFFKDAPIAKEETNILGESYKYDFDMEF